VDIAIAPLDPDLSVWDEGDLAAVFEAALGVPVDLVRLDLAPTLLEWEIVKSGVPILVSSPDEWTAFRIRVMADHADYVQAADQVARTFLSRAGGQVLTGAEAALLGDVGQRVGRLGDEHAGAGDPAALVREQARCRKAVVKLALAALTCVGMIGACKRSNGQPPPDQTSAPRSVHGAARATETTTGPTEDAAPAGDPAKDSASQIAAEVQQTMMEFVAYSESVAAILREHGKDCDLAAKHLASRAPVFAELGPRMMKVKQALLALPEQDREHINRQPDQAMEAFKARYPDAEALEQIANACEQTSRPFAEIAPKVMFQKKK
jgi:hypothetical protein